MKKIAVLGMGIFGTALALTANRSGSQVLGWARNKDVVEDINQKHVNTRYLPDLILPPSIKATSNISELFSFADIILLCVSAQATREVLQQIKPFVKPDTIIVLCAKGIEAESGKLLSEVANEEIPHVQLVVLSGPGFAVEIAKCKMASVTIAGTKESQALQVRDALATPYFRPYTTTDIISPQIGGSVKNVIAIASGVIEGAGFGDSARAALITRGLHEMGVLSRALHGLPETMMGMSGLGDLVLTANCMQSRNFNFGYEIGINGHAQDIIKNNTKTVEGIATAKAVIKRAHAVSIEMPICETVNKVLFENFPLDLAMKELLQRPFRTEGL